MKTYQIEADFRIVTTETFCYEVEAESLSDAIAKVEDGEVEPFDIRQHEPSESEFIGYDDSHEVKE